MNAQKDQIQSLVHEIDRVLSKAGPRLPWVMSGEAVEQRQLLERIRSYLATLQQQFPDDQLARRPEVPPYGYSPQPYGDPYRGAAPPSEATQQILQAVVQEMGYLRSSLTQPLQAELEALRLQRDSLVQEIRQLEARRQSTALPDGGHGAGQQQLIADFLQALMSQLQDRLAQQVAEAMLKAETRSLGYEAGYGVAALPSSGSSQPLLHPSQRVEHLQALQARSDQLLLSLDATLSTLFESLNRNVQSYQDSLSQGVERMHSLGSQSEAMFSALVNHWAQQLGREASSFIQSSTQGNRESPSVGPAKPPLAFPLPSSVAGNPNYTAPRAGDRSSEFKLPYPGIELPGAFLAPLGQEDNSSLKDLELEELDLSDLNLGEPDLTLLEQLELEDSTVDAGNAVMERVTMPPPSAFPANETTFFDDLEAAERTLPPPSSELTTIAESAQSVNTDDIDSALEFLEQLSASLQEQEPAPASTTTRPTVLDENVTVLPAEPVGEPTVVNSEVIDDFYNTLFGEEEDAALGSSASSAAIAAEAEAVASPTPITSIADPLTGPSLEENEGLVSAVEAAPPTESSEIEPVSDPISLDHLFGFGALSEPPQPQNSSGAEEVAELLTFENFLLAEEQPEPSSSRSMATPLIEAPPTVVQEDVSADELFDLISPTLAASQPQSVSGSAVAESVLPGEPELTLADLLSEPPSSAAMPVSNRATVEDSLNAAEDSYIPAAPDENLLATTEIPQEADLSLALDATTLQQLSEDLSSLESSTAPVAEEADLNLSTAALTEDESDSAGDADSLSALASSWDSLTLNEFATGIPTVPDEPAGPRLPVFPPAKPFPTSASNFLARNLSSTPAASEFEEILSPESEEVPPTATPAEVPNLTLDNLDDLFGDLPPANFSGSPTESASSSNPEAQESALEVTLEDVFSDFPATTIVEEPQTLEDVFESLKKNL